MATAAKNPFEKKATGTKTTAARGKTAAAKKDDEKRVDPETTDTADNTSTGVKQPEGSGDNQKATEEAADAKREALEAGAVPNTPSDAPNEAADDANVSLTANPTPTPEAVNAGAKVGAPGEGAELPKKSTGRRTAKQVEEEAAEREAAMQKQIDALREAINGSNGPDVTIHEDRVVGEGKHGGEVRLIGGDGKSLTNDHWRATKNGLVVQVGRASAQARQTFSIPVTLVHSLKELLDNFSEIEEA